MPSMSLREGRKVKYVHVVGQTFVAGLGTLKSNGISDEQQSYPGIVMELTFAGVLCSYRGNEFILPYGILGPITLYPKEQLNVPADAA
jgi:hypothetical protein